MARPRKDAAEARTCWVHVRLTAEEDLSVKMNAAAAGLSAAEFTRRLLLGQPVTPPLPRADKKLLYELNAIGNNANQLSYHMNAGRRFTDAWEDIAGRIYATIDKIWAAYGLEGGR
jgi:hypothetical protein